MADATMSVSRRKYAWSGLARPAYRGREWGVFRAGGYIL